MDFQAFLADRTVQAMLANFAAIFGCLAGASLLLARCPKAAGVGWLTATECTQSRAKAATETFWLRYAVFWVLSFGVIVSGQLFVWFEARHYLAVCGGLAAPLLLQPLVAPGVTGEAGVPLRARHCFKANVWIAIFSFIGNWWYTHYFYSVLQARYSMPAHDVNAVPVAMFFATHFYFTLYHVLAAKALRAVRRLYLSGGSRTFFECCLVSAMAYCTAFTESATISAYPCYSFENVHQAYTVGSAFYGIYFLVSYPLFASLDEDGAKPHSCKQAVWEALGAGMAVLMLLDVVRVALEIPLVVPLARPCKRDVSLTCAPFDGTPC